MQCNVMKKTRQPQFLSVSSVMQNWLQRTVPNSLKLQMWTYWITTAYDDVGKRFIYQYVQLFIAKETGSSNVAMFKHSLHKFWETILY